MVKSLEKNYKVQKFYKKYGFEKFSEHIFTVGYKKIVLGY